MSKMLVIPPAIFHFYLALKKTCLTQFGEGRRKSTHLFQEHRTYSFLLAGFHTCIGIDRAKLIAISSLCLKWAFKKRINKGCHIIIKRIYLWVLWVDRKLSRKQKSKFGKPCYAEVDSCFSMHATYLKLRCVCLLSFCHSCAEWDIMYAFGNNFQSRVCLLCLSVCLKVRGEFWLHCNRVLWCGQNF